MTGVEQAREMAVVLVAGGVIVLAFKALDGRLSTIRR